MNETTVDFDHFWAEFIHDSSPPSIKVMGKTAWLNMNLSLAEMQQLSRADPTNADQIETSLVKLYGREAYTDWMSQGMLFAQAPILILWGMLRIQGVEMSLPDVAKHMTNATGKALTSSAPTGAPLKRDSSNTTESVNTHLGPLVPGASTYS